MATLNEGVGVCHRPHAEAVTACFRFGRKPIDDFIRRERVQCFNRRSMPLSG